MGVLTLYLTNFETRCYTVNGAFFPSLRLFLWAFNEYAPIKCLKIKLQFSCHRTFLARFGSIRAMVRILIHSETKREKQTSKLFVLLFLHVKSLMNDSESQNLHKNRLSQGLGHALCTRCDPVSVPSLSKHSQSNRSSCVTLPYVVTKLILPTCMS